MPARAYISAPPPALQQPGYPPVDGESQLLSLEFIEEYTLPTGERRFRFRIKGTSIYINVTASNRDEAYSKALNLAKEVGLDKLLQEMARRQQF